MTACAISSRSGIATNPTVRAASAPPDPFVALGPTKAAAQRVATLRKDFQKAHADGMTALQSGDFDALGDAIKRERDIIEIQSELIEQSTGKKSTRRK